MKELTMKSKTLQQLLRDNIEKLFMTGVGQDFFNKT